jgi:hypothetical protein
MCQDNVWNVWNQVMKFPQNMPFVCQMILISVQLFLLLIHRNIIRI